MAGTLFITTTSALVQAIASALDREDLARIGNPVHRSVWKHTEERVEVTLREACLLQYLPELQRLR